VYYSRVCIIHKCVYIWWRYSVSRLCRTENVPYINTHTHWLLAYTYVLLRSRDQPRSAGAAYKGNIICVRDRGIYIHRVRETTFRNQTPSSPLRSVTLLCVCAHGVRWFISWIIANKYNRLLTVIGGEMVDACCDIYIYICVCVCVRARVRVL